MGQRTALLVLARSRAACAADAEDAVQEALVRALEHVERLDPLRVDGWLKTVTMNICRDMARERSRYRQRVVYQLRHMIPEPYVDEAVAERAYAVEVAQRMAALPGPQQAVLRLRADALPIEEIASRLGVTPKSAESLLSRGRRTMRAVASSLQAALVGYWLRPRSRRGAGYGSGALAATSVLAAVVVLASPPVDVTPPMDASRSVVEVMKPAFASHALRALSPDHAASRQQVKAVSRPALGGPALQAGPVDVRGGKLSRRKPQETLLQSVQACVRDGVTVSASYIGCNAAK